VSGQELHVVCDNYATHKHADVRKWLRHPENQRITLHFVPTSCSWLNLVECFFSVITRQAIRRGTFTSVKELIAAIALSSTPGTTNRGRSPGPRTPTRSSPRSNAPRLKQTFLPLLAARPGIGRKLAKLGGRRVLGWPRRRSRPCSSLRQQMICPEAFPEIRSRDKLPPPVLYSRFVSASPRR
jgi:hypothetical protein